MADAGEQTLSVRLFGPLRVSLDGRDIPLGPPRQRALFAVLAIRSTHVVHTSELIDAVWGENLPGGPRGGVHTYVAGLRRVLEPARGRRSPGRVLESLGSGYRLNIPAEQIDAIRFEHHRDDGRRAWRAGALGDAEKSFDAALDLFDGVMLGDVPGRFAQTQRDRLADERLSVVEDRIDVLLAQGRHAEVSGELRGLTLEHPLRERMWAQLMLALYREGRQADALAAFGHASTVCADELGLDPGPTLTRLHQRILLADPALAAPTAVSAAVEPPPVRCTLPRDIECFTGRERDVGAVLAMTARAASDAGERALVVCAIDGMAGVGKTALAVHLAHRLRDRYPDAALYLDLHGHTVGTRPMSSAAALDKLLRALDVPGERIPADVDDKAALWRARLAGRRVLLVLDNAVDAAQIRPLLPGAAGALVLITARRRLSGLDDTEFCTLDVLSRRDAVALFTAVVGSDRTAAEPAVTEAVVALCGHLPLAVQIAAARLRHRRSWSVADLLDRLRDQQERLSELRADDRSVAVTFELSYRSLDPAGQRVFRLLGLFPGPDFGGHAVAALAGVDLRRADQLLQDLMDAHLLDEPQPDRYRLHDLLGVFAARQCQDEETADDRRAALARLLDYYLHTIDRAEELLRPQRLDRAAAPAPGTMVYRLDNRAKALAWLDSERANLVPIVRAAIDFPAHAWQISRYLWGFFEARGHWPDWVICCQLALPGTRQLGDRLAQARILVGLGVAEHHLRRYDQAIEHFMAASVLMRETGFRSGEAGVLTNLGNTYHQIGRLTDSITCQERSLAISQEIGDDASAAIALTNLGELYLDADRFADAVTCQEKALAMFRRSGDRRLEGIALDHLARAYLATRRYDEALAHCRDSLAARRDAGDRYGETDTLDCLAQICERTGQFDQAARHWRDALAIAENLGAPIADDLRARLGKLAPTVTLT